ncbi:MAG: hypothetical protein JST23_03115 [Bacteroidetes bacterium]|nr:hypothetical protein [Bacteroidota bacterium]
MSESYYNGILPLWTPFLNLGYPLHGDMQSGVWNPFVQLFSLFGPYNLYTLQLETLLYVYLSGIGMFSLLKYFKVHPYANLLASIAYMLCGFNSDSAQYLNWITSASCLPFLFLFYYRLLKENKVIWSLGTSLVLYVFFTSAYPADFILSIYLMIGLFIWNYFQVRKSQPKWLLEKSNLLNHFILIITFILLSSPAILSYLQSLPLTERGSGADFEQVMSNPLHPFLLSSYTTPLGVWKMPGVNITDPLERNSYIGIVAFVFLIFSFFIKSKEPLIKFSKWAFFIFLFFSFGEMGGLRTISYYTLPLMNTFRHPANAKIFTTFFAVLLTAFSFNDYVLEKINFKKLKTAILIVTSFLLLVWMLSVFTPFNLFAFNHSFKTEANKGFIEWIKDKFDNLSFADIVLFNTAIQLFFLHFIWWFVKKKRSPKLLLTLGIANSVLFTILFQPFTVVKMQKASEVQMMVNENSVSEYSIPDITKSLNTLGAGNEQNISEIGCAALYNKKPTRSEYRITPSNLLNQNNFWFNEDFRNLIMSYPLFYRADAISDTSIYRQAKVDSTSKWAFINKKVDIKIFDKDSALDINITKFTPNNFEGAIKTGKGGYFVLLQNHYPRWKLYIDNKQKDIQLTNLSFMGFELPPGNHHFSFQYEAKDIKLSILVSLLTFLLIIILFIAKARKLL